MDESEFLKNKAKQKLFSLVLISVSLKTESCRGPFLESLDN